ncbi:MAG: DUF1805 domain-containing protein [Candidatus Omnitrophica bacterium]|nr:DUF1805 domain-containing protein [Candidatus Omnitrophota bacterium]
MKIVTKKIKVGKKKIHALSMPLATKTLIVLVGSKGYIMCGYLNLAAAKKFNDTAIKIVGVSTIAQALGATVHSCTLAAKKLGIHKGQPVKDALRIIA